MECKSENDEAYKQQWSNMLALQQANRNDERLHN